jgi:DNA mismatch repair protein MutL
MLLLPVDVEIDATTLSRIREHEKTLDRMGFDLEEFGEKSVLLRAIPAILGDRDPARLIRLVGDSLAEDGIVKDEMTLLRDLEPMDRLFATIACHSARRAGDKLQVQEQMALLLALDEVPWAPTCPHGRPVAVPIEKLEIERRFARR